MYTSTIKKLLFSDDGKHWSQHYPHMVLPLLGADTDLVALAGVLAEDKRCRRHGAVAAVITWIVANRPAELTDFCNAYGKPATVYDAIGSWYLPETVSKHFHIHELVSEAINPDAKLCKDTRIGSMGISKRMLAKAPVSEPVFGGKDNWLDGYEYDSEETAIQCIKDYLVGKHFEVFFIHTDESYNNWLDAHYQLVAVGVGEPMPTGKCMRRKKEKAPSRHGVCLAQMDISILAGVDKHGDPIERDRNIRITAGDEENEWVVKMHHDVNPGVGIYANTGRVIETLGSFTAAKIVSPTNYKQIVTEVAKLPALEPKPEEVKV